MVSAETLSLTAKHLCLMLVESTKQDPFLSGVEHALAGGDAEVSGAVPRWSRPRLARNHLAWGKRNRRPRERAAVGAWGMPLAAAATRRSVRVAEGNADASAVPVVARLRLHILGAVLRLTARLMIVHGRAATMSDGKCANAVDRTTAVIVVGDKLLGIDDTAAGGPATHISVSRMRRACFGFRCGDECRSANDQECEEFLHGRLNWDSRRSTRSLPDLFNEMRKSFVSLPFQTPRGFPMARGFEPRQGSEAICR